VDGEDSVAAVEDSVNVASAVMSRLLKLNLRAGTNPPRT
jgi:hypothetical protein